MVTSVPSDAPDDFAALRDLKNKQVSDCFSSVLECMRKDFVNLVNNCSENRACDKISAILLSFY